MDRTAPSPLQLPLVVEMTGLAPWEACRLLAANPRPTVPDLPPFQGGIAGLFGYDLARRLERLPRAQFDDFHVPDLAVGVYDWVLAFDHAKWRSWLIVTGLPD